MTILKRTVIVIFCISLLIFIVAVVKELISSDSSIPEITSDRDVLEVPCNYTESQLLEGLSAYDQDDGDLTSKIVVEACQDLLIQVYVMLLMLSLILLIIQLALLERCVLVIIMHQDLILVSH